MELVLNGLAAFGPAGLFVLAFLHDIFSPVPPELLLLPLGLQSPSHAWWLGLLTVVGSVLGGVVGYLIGKTLGHTTLAAWIGPKGLKRAEDLFRRNDIAVLFLATFTPLPFKLVTIPAGFLRVPLRRFLAASLVARSLRFMAEAAVIYWLGPTLVQWVFSNIGWLSVIVGATGTGAWLLWRKHRRNS